MEITNWDAVERSAWEETPLYLLMCEVVNGERSDWPTGMGEPSHVERMSGHPAPWERDAQLPESEAQP